MAPKRKHTGAGESAPSSHDIKDMSRAKNTKHQYLIYYQTFLRWISEHDTWSSLLQDSDNIWGRIKLPLPHEAATDFLRHQGYDENGRPRSKSTVGAPRSMLLYLHEQNGVAVATDYESNLKKFAKGFNNNRGSNKEKGLIKSNDASAAFSAWLHKVLKKSITDNEAFCGLDLGVHSMRKGIVNFLLTCVNGGPSAIAAYLRVGWSLGTQDSYLFLNDASDEFTGRFACGLDMNVPAEFMILPPHFKHGCTP